MIVQRMDGKENNAVVRKSGSSVQAMFYNDQLHVLQNSAGMVAQQ